MPDYDYDPHEANWLDDLQRAEQQADWQPPDRPTRAELERDEWWLRTPDREAS